MTSAEVSREIPSFQTKGKQRPSGGCMQISSQDGRPTGGEEEMQEEERQRDGAIMDVTRQGGVSVSS